MDVRFLISKVEQPRSPLGDGAPPVWKVFPKAPVPRTCSWPEPSLTSTSRSHHDLVASHHHQPTTQPSLGIMPHPAFHIIVLSVQRPCKLLDGGGEHAFHVPCPSHVHNTY